jgi:YD repeat-containing protein
MNFERRTFRFATRWMPIFLLLLFVAPRARARQDEKPSPAQTPAHAPVQAPAQKPSKNARPTDSQHPTTPGQNDAPKSRPPIQRDRGSNDGKQDAKPNNTDKTRGPGSVRPGRPEKPSTGESSAPEAPSNPRPDGSQQPTRPGDDSGNTSRPPVRGGAPVNGGKPRDTGNVRPGRPEKPATGESSTPEAPSNPRPDGSQQPTRPGDENGNTSKPPVQGGTPANGDKPRGFGNGRPGRAGKPSAEEASNPGNPKDTRPAEGQPSTKPGKDDAPSTKPTGKGDTPTSSGKPRGAGTGRPDNTEGRPGKSVRANGTVIERGKNGRTTSVTTPRGTTARLDADGRVTSIRDKRGNTINRGPRGERRVETVRADHSRVVSFGQRGGFVERRFDRGGRQYVRRTYVVGRHSYVSVYRGYHYHGVPYYWYVPPFYYAPAYYWWAYNPWPRPIYYSWGWYGSPWYRPYGYYFAPYPVYPYASLWLTDYVLAENLRLAYEADESAGIQPDHSEGRIVMAAYHPGGQAANDQQKSGSAVLTPEVKQMIAEEVKAVIADDQKAASSPSGSSQASAGDEIPAALDPNHRVFVVFSVLEVTTNGETCSLTSSDVVKRTEDTPDDDNSVAVKILASKEGDCAIGSSVRMQTTDLNDMQNHLREQVDAGMKMLSEKQGKDGLPTAPPAKPRAFAEGTAEADPTAAADLKEQAKEADQTEKEVQQETSTDDNPEN